MTVGSLAFAEQNGSAVIAFGPIGVGLLLVYRASLMPREPHELFSAQQFRRPEDLRPQVAGMPCVVCDARIVIATEGILCERCDKPIHHACAGRHALSHREGEPPYRS
jgi:hypothetical protein